MDSSTVQTGLLCASAFALGASVAYLIKDRALSHEDELLVNLLRGALAQQTPNEGFVSGKAAAVTRAEARYQARQHSRQTSEFTHDADALVGTSGREGFSMEDARKRSEQMKSDFKDLTPAEVLSALQKGNARFWTGNAVRPEKCAFERRALIMQQFPKTAVLGCSDSRVPVEVVFDQGLGEMFVVRVAGNCLDTATTASLQFAVHHLKVKVLMVMGHEGCGAVKAAALPLDQIEKEPAALSSTLKMLKAGLDERRLATIHDCRAYDREAVITNIRRQVEGLCQDAAIMQKVVEKELIVVGCFYEISTGIVDFFMEVTETTEKPRLVIGGASEGVQSRMEFLSPRAKPVANGQTGSPAKGQSMPSFILPSPDEAPVKEFDMTSPRNISSLSSPLGTAVRFSHVHIYCDALKPIEEYKRLEEKLNALSDTAGSLIMKSDAEAGRKAWLNLSESHGHPTGNKDPASFSASGQDVVEQMLVGLGWRITGFCALEHTRTVVVTSNDETGVKVAVTAHNKLSIAELALQPPIQKAVGSLFDQFDAWNLQRFALNQSGRAGIAVLGFEISKGGVSALYKKYKELHQKLLLPGTPKESPGIKILEVFAYYKGEKNVSDADTGTVLRFIETNSQSSFQGSSGASRDFWVLPGVQRIGATFDRLSVPAYCDHWVSNVVSRGGFLETLEETLGFTPKVDFNAGVVAAGEAQIESTVTGNDPGTVIANKEIGLKDQSQVYLPINNALSEVGHVHLFLKEIGQGIQHIAQRVSDLPKLVQRANDIRKITGAGFTFLSIPNSYYGSLTPKYLSRVAGLDATSAQEVWKALRTAGIVDKSDIVDLTATSQQVSAALPKAYAKDTSLIDHVLRARYSNLFALLRDHLSEESYLRIVRNKILVDVQGEDLLFQIFTSNVLQRIPGQEAPFFEFIQRVCSERKDPKTGATRALRPGCGGFGIRNFLTLFLSIEVSKAANARAEAESAGNQDASTYYGSMVDAFTNQLDESNPILTAISDAMTAEGEALESGNTEEASRWSAEKMKGQQDLMKVSTKYKDYMRELRQNAPASITAAAGA